MSGSIGFAVGGDQLVEGMALGEFNVELAAEFAGTTGTRGVETIDDGWINVFHEKYLLRKVWYGFACLVRPSRVSSEMFVLFADAFLLYRPEPVKAALLRLISLPD
jgi:hypothetical protein